MNTAGFTGEASLEGDARGYALLLLGSRAYSSAELNRKLREKGFPPAVCETVLSYLESRGYIDDAGLARHEAKRSLARGFGPYRVKLRLRQRGLSASLADETLAAYAESDIRHSCLVAAERKIRSLPVNLEPEKVRARVGQHLQRKGFHWDTIEWVLMELGLAEL